MASVIPVLAHRRAALFHGDAMYIREVLAPNSVDALVTDPPAGIGFMGKAWDRDKGGRDSWIEWLSGVLRGAFAAMKPGAHGLVWALPRTSHWTGMACEEAGFEVRDRVSHFFGTGFPKSLDVSKAIDAALGVEPTITGEKSARLMAGHLDVGSPTIPTTIPTTKEAAQWSGWGTALKPACEDWWLIRKPLVGTVAENVMEYGTGALNIDECGRWPAHVTLDEEAAAILDEQSGITTSPGKTGRGQGGGRGAYGVIGAQGTVACPSDTGGASRFFYVAKAPRREKDAGLDHLPVRSGGEATGREDDSDGLNNPRAGAGRTGGARNFHPTVKSIDLMRWLIRLITPPRGLVLDLFAGSGTTGVAALEEGMDFVGVELDAEYIPITEGRLRHALYPPQPSLFGIGGVL